MKHQTSNTKHQGFVCPALAVEPRLSIGLGLVGLELFGVWCLVFGVSAKEAAHA